MATVGPEMDPRAEALKEQGNVQFRQQHFYAAIKHYTESLRIQPHSITFGNRANAYLRLNELSLALADCNEGLSLNRRNFKLLFRRAKIWSLLNQTDLAIGDMQLLRELVPENMDQPEIKEFQAHLESLKHKPRRSMEIEPVEKGEEFAEGKFFSVPVTVKIIDQEKKEKENEGGACDEEVAQFEGAMTKMKIRGSAPLCPPPALTSLPPPPRTFSYFAAHFELLKHTPAQFAAYFETIPLAEYDSLFSTLIDAYHVGCLLEGFHQRLLTGATKSSTVAASLLELSRVERFDIAVAFLSTDEIKKAHDVASMLDAPFGEIVQAAFTR